MTRTHHSYTTDARAALAQEKTPARAANTTGAEEPERFQMSSDPKVSPTTHIRQAENVSDPLVAKLDAVGFFTPPTPKITPEQAEALAPVPSWADRPDYERDWEDHDGGYWINDRATIATTDLVRVSMNRETAITGAGTVAHTIESVRVAHADEDFWLETRHLGDVLDQIRAAAAEAGVLR